MSHTSRTGSQISQIRLPTINRLDLEQIAEFAAIIKLSPLNPVQIEELKKYMNRDPGFIEIARLHNKFIEIKDNYNLLTGLSPQQIETLQQLVKKTRVFKELRKTKEVGTQDYKDFLQNERQLLPLTQIVEYWTSNCEALKKLEVWENIGVMIANDSKENQETESTLKNKLHYLTDIKNDWIKQQFFAGYSAQQLLVFYNDYLCKIENWIVDFLKAKENTNSAKPEIIRQYLQYLLNQLRVLKLHAINSMLARLSCSEYYCDIRHDDLLKYLSDQIKLHCGVNILKSNRNLLPRRSSSTEQLEAFFKIITTYIKQNPDEKSIAQQFQQLKMTKCPSDWNASLSISPIIMYVENLFPLVLEAYHLTPNLSQLILDTDALLNKNFVLNKLRRLLKYATLERSKLNGKKLDASDITQDKILTQLIKKINNLLTDAGNKVNIEIQKQIHGLFDEVFSETEISSTSLGNVINKINNAVLFNKKYLQINYNHHCDLILLLSQRIKNILAKNQFILPNEIKNILKLSTALLPEIKVAELDNLKKILVKLPDTAQKLNEENEGELQHLLLQFLESQQLSQSGLRIAVERHKHVAIVYGEKWDDMFKTQHDMAPEQEYIYLICSYIKNVLLKVIQISPYIDFNNFDNNEMCVTLFNMETDYKNTSKKPLIRQEQLEGIRKEFQQRIFFKLNDLFQIKSYLHCQSPLMIDIDKLKFLLKRINQFFTYQGYKTAILHSIMNAVRVLLKNYCLTILQQDVLLNKNYLYSLNDLFKENLLLKIAQDAEIVKTLKTYIDTYNGSKNTIATFLIELLPKQHIETENLIKPYAKKRLDYLKASRDVTPEDYLFFNNFTQIAAVNSLFADAKNHFRPLLSQQYKQSWDKNVAYLNELFADEPELFQYRLKRVLELLALGNGTNQADSAALLTEFELTIHPFRLIKDQIIDPTILIDDKTSFTKWLDQCIAQQPWSYLLEALTNRCGTASQNQLLHFKLTLSYLNQNQSCPDTWLAKHLKNQSENFQHLDALDNNQEFETQFFRTFFGDQHIKMLCDVIQRYLTILKQADKDLYSKQINKEDYKSLTQIITTIKPFVRLYLLHGTDEDAKASLKNLSHLENKLALHYRLNTVLKRQTSLLNISKENTELHNLILAIIDTVRKIESKQILSEHDINHYLLFFDKEVLTKLEILLTKNPQEIIFKVLYLLTNLMTYFASDNMKLLLLEANKKQVTSNPHWLTLINHFDERKFVSDLASPVNDAKFADPKNDFKNILQFAQHLNQVKKQTHQLIKYNILKEANIEVSIQDKINLSAIFRALKLKNQQYIKLWITCAEKLQQGHVDSQLKLSYINFIIKFLNKVAGEILIKARDDHELLNEFILHLSHIYVIKERLLELSQEFEKINSPRTQQACINPLELQKTIRPLFMTIDKSLALQLIHKVDKFALKMLTKKQLLAFRAIYQDVANANNLQNAVAVIKFALGLNNLKETTKLAAILPICHQLQKIYLTGTDTSQLLPLVEELIRTSSQDPTLKKSSSYCGLLTELKSLSIKYFSLQDNRSFLFQRPNKPHSFF